MRIGTDRGSHCFYTPEAGGKVDRTRLTQVGRALGHLGVDHIAAYSPRARGRSERVFPILQDRLAKALALAGAATIEAANAFIRDACVPARNARFAVNAEQEGVAFVAIPGVDLGEILPVREERAAGNGNWVTFNRLKPQIPESPPRAHFVTANVTANVKANVKARQRHDGPHAIFQGPRCLGRYGKMGACAGEEKAA